MTDHESPTPARLGRIIAVGLFALTITWVPVGQARSGAAAPPLIPAPTTPLRFDAGWLETLNWYRAAAHLPPVTAESAWVDGIEKHLGYIAQTPSIYTTGIYESQHTENPASPYYTPEGAAAGASSNLAPYHGDERAAIEVWMRMPYHGSAMVSPYLERSAFGAAWGGVGLDVNRGRGVVAQASVVTFPGDGATVGPNVSIYGGGETPNPLEHCPGWYGVVGVTYVVLADYTNNDPVTSATYTDPFGAKVSLGSDQLCVFRSGTVIIIFSTVFHLVPESIALP